MGDQEQNPVLLTGSDRFEHSNVFLGQGTYGRVEKGLDKVTKRDVAIKMIKLQQNTTNERSDQSVAIFGVHFTTVRELLVMKEVNHPNVMPVIDTYAKNGFLCMAMELMSTDLKKIIQNRSSHTEASAKCIAKQLLSGLLALHKAYFLHRDLSPANVFLNSDGICKIADFGLSRSFGSRRVPPDGHSNMAAGLLESLGIMTDTVVTLWYRAPELLLGACQYGPAIDIWSVGCIVAEILRGKPLFAGTNEVDQLSRIYHLRGTPTDENWPNSKKLPRYTEFSKANGKDLSEMFTDTSKPTIALLERLLALDPNNRPSAKEALEHEAFKKHPMCCAPDELVK